VRAVSSSSSMQHVVQMLRGLRTSQKGTPKNADAAPVAEPEPKADTTGAGKAARKAKPTAKKERPVELTVNHQHDDAGVKKRTHNKYEALLSQFNEFKEAHAKQDAATAKKIESLQTQLDDLQIRNEKLTDVYDAAEESIQTLTNQLESVQDTLSQLLDYEPPTDSTGDGASGNHATQDDIHDAFQGLSKRLNELTKKFDEMLAEATNKNTKATEALFERITEVVQNARNSQLAIQEAREERNNARMARMMTNLTIQVQASANFFKMQEDTMMRVMQGMFRNGAMGSLLRTAMTSFGNGFSGNRLNTFA